MKADDLGQHISRQFNADLEGLRAQVNAMGALVEEQLDRALEAIATGDAALGEAVATEDYKVNGMEVSIDEECGRILALRSPAASDLRLIIAVVKTITDLERIGDEVEKIGSLAAAPLGEDGPRKPYREIRNMGQQVRRMLRAALDALTRLDAVAAVEAKKQDRIVDEEFEAISRQSITFMMEDPRSIRRVLDLMWTARALERIGDHAKNICEYVVYMVHGKDVRHTRLEDVEREVNRKS